MPLEVQVDVLEDIMRKIMDDKTIRTRVIKHKLNKQLHSNDIYKKTYAINKIVSDGKGIDVVPDEENIVMALENTKVHIAEVVARKYVENSIEKDVEKAIIEKQEKYIEDVRLGIIRKRKGSENGKTLKKYSS